jgi:cation diffusion facilitator CzcD-associated flavoprotein CzcO
VDLTGKHVGLIGNGSSAIQVLPAIYNKVAKVTSFIRSPTWVTPVQNIPAREYTDEERQKFATDPAIHLQYRKDLETAISGLFPILIADSPAQKEAKSTFTVMMQESLQNERLAGLVIPKWGVGCRRLTPGVGYLEALSAEKTNVIYGPIESITETGVKVKDNDEQPVDVLICATGFDTSYKPGFSLTGSTGESLNDAWASECRSYLGMATPGFPNYFMFMGPNSPVGNGPFLIAVEAQADYMLKMMNRWQTENIKSFSPKDAAVDDFVEFTQKWMESAIWREDCRSWYKNNSVSGKVTALWPGSSMHYLEAVAEPRYDDWDFTYTGNRFAYLGNGFSQAEKDKTADWAYYIRNEDDGPYLSRGKQIKHISKSGTITRSDEMGVILL